MGGQPGPQLLSPISSLGVGHGDERVLKGAIVHCTLEVVVHGARLGEEALHTRRRCRSKSTQLLS